MNTFQVDIPYEAIEALCHKYPIRKLALFGSVLRDDFRPDSDVDVLIEFELGVPVTYFDLADMQFELGQIFGRDVDIGTPDMLSKYIRNTVLNGAQVIYESG